MKKDNTNRVAALKKAIPYGGIKEVAKRANTTIYTVSRVIRGGSNNPIVLRVLAEYIEEQNRTKIQLNTAVELANIQ